MTCSISLTTSSLKDEVKQLRLVVLLQQVVDFTEQLQFAGVKDGDAVAHVLHVGKLVAAHHDRLALLFEPQDQVLHFARADRVEAAGRLVEEHQVRIVDQGLGQADTPRHTLGVFFELPAAGPVEPDHFDQGVGPLAARGGRTC